MGFLQMCDATVSYQLLQQDGLQWMRSQVRKQCHVGAIISRCHEETIMCSWFCVLISGSGTISYICLPIALKAQ